jgi:hypothetical protein
VVDVGVWLPLLARAEAQSGVGPDPSEGVPGLLQDAAKDRATAAEATAGQMLFDGRSRRTLVNVLDCGPGEAGRTGLLVGGPRARPAS